MPRTFTRVLLPPPGTEVARSLDDHRAAGSTSQDEGFAWPRPGSRPELDGPRAGSRRERAGGGQGGPPRGGRGPSSGVAALEQVVAQDGGQRQRLVADL